MAKRFFYVCAGLFLLTLSWHLGAKSTQAGVPITIGGVSARACVMTQDRMVFSCDREGGGAVHVYAQPIPGSEPIVAVEASETAAFAVAADGAVYRAFVGGPWVQTGDVGVFAPTGAESRSWGALKDEYRK